ncbi:hypothetical protein [Legionella taurinensis]|uniref:hypothetical protein n=1 Tax=Legionella taurinensis TaxID=70611 RepID=UPI000E01D2DD|nr:hypothetical protein [Legionella taurinensis]MDX1837051.1 hypothetical protein [Legionella taurinensis]STY25929.1 Uncharacterised protein [Legionella taurinensis]
MKNRHQEKKSIRKISKQTLENVAGGNRNPREMIDADDINRRLTDFVSRFHRR